MKLNELSPKEGAVKSRMRVGRGIGSGKGKTCGRGHKGQKARTGVSLNGFEGGQMSIFFRLPKFGFHSPNRTHYAPLTLKRLQTAIDKKQIDAKKAVDEDALVKAKVIRRKQDGIKLLATGEIKDKITLKVTAASAGAIKAIEKAGGKVEIIEKKQPKPVPRNRKK